MPSGACINHPAVEAAGRCKQCSRPFCNACRVLGPTGQFCSETCKQKHEVFVQQAQAQDHKKGGLGIKGLVKKGVKIAIVVVIICVAITGADALVADIPVISQLSALIKGLIGM